LWLVHFVGLGECDGGLLTVDLNDSDDDRKEHYGSCCLVFQAKGTHVLPDLGVVCISRRHCCGRSDRMSAYACDIVKSSLPCRPISEHLDQLSQVRIASTHPQETRPYLIHNVTRDLQGPERAPGSRYPRTLHQLRRNMNMA
jgi:hypothetical protein